MGACSLLCQRATCCLSNHSGIKVLHGVPVCCFENVLMLFDLQIRQQFAGCFISPVTNFFT